MHEVERIVNKKLQLNSNHHLLIVHLLFPSGDPECLPRESHGSESSGYLPGGDPLKQRMFPPFVPMPGVCYCFLSVGLGGFLMNKVGCSMGKLETQETGGLLLLEHTHQSLKTLYSPWQHLGNLLGRPQVGMPVKGRLPLIDDDQPCS